MKNLAAVILGLGIFGAAGAQASDYGLCINRSQGDWRKQVVCNQDETRSLMREITTIYGRLARNPLFGKFNRERNRLTINLKAGKPIGTITVFITKPPNQDTATKNFIVPTVCGQ